MCSVEAYKEMPTNEKGAIGSSMLSAFTNVLAQTSQNSLERDIFKYNKELVNKDLLSQYAALSERQSQERTAAALRIQDIGRETTKAVGLTNVISGERGVTGNTVQILVQDFVRQEAEAIYITDKNRRMLERQLQREKEGARAQAQRAIMSSFPTTPKPSFLGSALSIASAGAGAYFQVQAANTQAGI